jgi:hypothetical protein
MDSKVIEIFIP